MPNTDRPSAFLAVIGGSGFYRMPGLEDVERWSPQTPFGAPSDEIVIGTLHDKRVAFLPRHGAGHRLMPHEIPVRANIWSLKALGVQGILAVSAVGSLRAEIAPGHMVTPDQISRMHHYDATKIAAKLAGWLKRFQEEIVAK